TGRAWYDPSVGSVGSWVGEVPIIAGATIGSLVGGIPGAAAGGFSGKLIQSGIRDLAGLPGYENAGEEVKQAAITGGVQGVLEAGGKYVLSPFARGVTEEAQGAVQLLKDYTGVDIKRLLPSQYQAEGSISQRVLGVIERVADLGPWRSVAATKKEQQEALTQW